MVISFMPVHAGTRERLFGERLTARVVVEERGEPKLAAGKRMLHVFAAIAAFGRDLLAGRTNAGMAAARARGRKGGRLPTLMFSDNRLTRAMFADAVVSVTEATKDLEMDETLSIGRFGEGNNHAPSRISVPRPHRACA